VCIHKLDEMANFRPHFKALVTKAMCQIWWTFINNFKSYSPKKLFIGLLFCGHGVHQACEQEAQLMLTTGSTRLAVSRGQQTWYHVRSIATFR